MTFTEALLLIGLTANFVRAGDLFLTEAQKEAFGDRIESLTLWLHYAEPLKWLEKHFIGTIFDTVTRSIAVVSGLLWMLLISSNTALSARDSHSSWVEHGIGAFAQQVAAQPVAGLFYSAMIFLSLCATWLVIPLFIRDTDQSKLRSAAHYLILTVTLGVVTFSFMHWYGRSTFPEQLHNDFLENLGITSVMIPLEVQTACWLGLLLIGLIFGFLESLIRSLRWICWRIVSYAKGPLAAVLVIATLVLGVVELAELVK